MNRRALLLQLLPDVVLPIAAYYGGRALGLGPTVALAVGALVALLRTGFVAVARRRFDGLAALVGAGLVAGLVLSLATGDARFLLARESVVSGLLGLVLLGSCLVRRPLLNALVRRLHAGSPDTLAHWERSWRERPDLRRTMTLITAVWGAGALAESLVRIPLVYRLPVDVMTGVSTALQLGTAALLLAWTLWYRHHRARAAARRSLVTT